MVLGTEYWISPQMRLRKRQIVWNSKIDNLLRDFDKAEKFCVMEYLTDWKLFNFFSREILEEKLSKCSFKFANLYCHLEARLKKCTDFYVLTSIAFLMRKNRVNW